MNKKIYLLFLLIITIIIFNTKCSFKIQSLSNVGTTVYIDSIGIDYNDKTDKYILYYHSTNTRNYILYGYVQEWNSPNLILNWWCLLCDKSKSFDCTTYRRSGWKKCYI